MVFPPQSRTSILHLSCMTPEYSEHRDSRGHAIVDFIFLAEHRVCSTESPEATPIEAYVLHLSPSLEACSHFSHFSHQTFFRMSCQY